MCTLTVVIVSYNVAPLLRGCLESIDASIARNGERLVVNVLVVDNASADGSAEMVATEFPHVRLIASGENLGFTGGNNLALRSLGFSGLAHPSIHLPQSSDFVLLLNPDTYVEKDALGRMLAFLQDTPRAGAVGAHLSYGNGAFQHGAFHFPGLLQVALDLLPLAAVPGLRRVVPRLLESSLNGRYQRALWQGVEPFPVDFILGAALMVRGNAIREVGVLDDDYFMYCEEMDWCLRLQDAGWSCYALPTARITHLEAQSSRQVRWDAFERLWRSRFQFYQKQYVHYPSGHLYFVRLLVRLGLWIRSALAQRNFAQGTLSGTLLERELAAYAAIRRL